MEIMATIQKSHTELNPIQVSLLRLFNIPMSEHETNVLKKLMVSHYSALLEEEVTKVVAKKGYTQKDFDAMLNAED
jgi:hypothetical protein